LIRKNNQGGPGSLPKKDEEVEVEKERGQGSPHQLDFTAGPSFKGTARRFRRRKGGGGGGT